MIRGGAGGRARTRCGGQRGIVGWVDCVIEDEVGSSRTMSVTFDKLSTYS